MTNITLEQIDAIMQRANVSYAEAKEALEQTTGDMVEALLRLEQNQKIKPAPQPKESCGKRLKGFIHNLNQSSFIMKKGEHTFINLPLAVAILLFIVCLPLSFIGIIVALVLGVKMNIEGENEVAEKFNSTFSH
nr:DUF4342 domain-containing protein [uncultured Cellulosilyticum sp.]